MGRIHSFEDAELVFGWAANRIICGVLEKLMPV
jgi:hypothetical protein